ncbi:MAG: Rpn family recombination-promoting nuclease/putative transposase, partial [Segatella copri]
FYSTFPIREQAPKGSEWDFKLNHVYTIALLNFNMNEAAFNKEEIRHHVQLCDTATHKIFYDKLEFIYVEIAKFDKSLDELETLYDKWLYALKNLYKLTQRPKALCDKVFDRLFEEAEIARFTPQEQREYEASKMAYRDIKNSIDTAKREGKEEGLAEGMEKGLAEGMERGMTQRSLEIARKMLANGMDTATVMKITGLSAEQLELK